MAGAMSARAMLDTCIKVLEDSLGIAPKDINEPRALAASTPPATTARQLLDNVIATLEASLCLQPDGALPDSKKGKDVAKASGKARGRVKKAVATPAASAADQPEGSKVDLRVGRITKVWVHESADKLYCEEIDVGEDEPRKIASGLVPHYSMQEMKERRVVVMCNLKPRTLKGFKSQGMVVCAVAALEDGKEKVELVTPPEGADVGERLYFEGLGGGPFAPVSAAQMEKKKVLDKVLPELATDGDGTVRWRGHPLVSSQGTCTAPTVKNGAVR